jgi:hypothetical protein
MRLSLAFTLISLSLAACGGDDDTNTPDASVSDVGFNKPTAGLQANMQGSDGSWTSIGPADLSCLNTPTTDTPTTVDVALTTTVKDFQNQTTVANATVTAFKGIDYATVFDTQTSDTDGNVTVTVPTGTTRFGFKMTADNTMPTFLLNQKVDPGMATQTLGEIQSVSSSTATLLPALINQTRTPGTGVAAGALRDCQEHELSNFVVTISSTPGTATPLAGSEAFYFSLSPALPVVHHTAESANKNGLFILLQVPTAPMAYVQAWGYKTDADATAGGDMTLISELAVPVVADTVITGSFEPIRQ